MKLKEIIKGELSELYARRFGVAPGGVEDVAEGGSSRIYLRILAPEGAPEGVPPTVVGTYGADRAENEAFCRLAEAFRRTRPSVARYAIPAIYARDDEKGIYLQEDFGSRSLSDLLAAVRGGGDGGSYGEVGRTVERIVRDTVCVVLDSLLTLQTTPEREWRDATLNEPFGRQRVLWDLNYFKYSFLKVADLVFDEPLLEADFQSMASDLAGYPEELAGFMYRDFQSRNVMMATPDALPGFIDFQGGMAGPVVYDAVSFLWQVKAGFPAEFRTEMLRRYVGRLVEMRGGDAGEFMAYASRLAAWRTLQVLGAYGFRGLIEKKSHFLQSIPGALRNLEEFVAGGVLAPYPELERVCRGLISMPRFRHEERLPGRLRVQILSFSYKKGYPENLTGNGGGYVFDCRWMHNPGRYDEYRPLTGRDKEVIDFLEGTGEVQKFLENVCGLVCPAVEVYRRRGFSDLQVAFGCTGGRHRSLYCAERLYGIITAAYPDVEVELIHRERGWRKSNF
ncbi:MAG: phosphotransferase [Bacteroides sp.]|nr:phosphotransferase [Bacteroides sp.]